MSPAARKDRIDAFGASLLVGFSVLLGLNQALVKLVNVGFSPFFQVGLRSACAFVLVLLYALYRHHRNRLSDPESAGLFPRDTWLPGLINGLLFSTEFCLLFLALDLTSVSRVSLFFYTMPLWVAIGAHFLIPGERLNATRIAGLALAFAGIALGLTGGGVATEVNMGDLLALLGALAWGAIALLTRTTRLASASPEENLLYQLAVSAVIVIPLAVMLGDTVREPDAGLLAIFTFQVIVVVAIGFVVWFWILSVYPVANMASFSLLTPVFGIFFGWLMFDDALSLSFFAALGLVFAGLLLVNRP